MTRTEQIEKKRLEEMRLQGDIFEMFSTPSGQRVLEWLEARYLMTQAFAPIVNGTGDEAQISYCPHFAAMRDGQRGLAIELISMYRRGSKVASVAPDDKPQDRPKKAKTKSNNNENG